MCHKEKTEAELKDRSVRTFYKTFVKKENYIESLYLKYKVKEPGKIRVPPEKINTDMIGAGVFHARLKQENIQNDKPWFDFMEIKNFVCIPIIVRIEDVVAYENI